VFGGTVIESGRSVKICRGGQFGGRCLRGLVPVSAGVLPGQA